MFDEADERAVPFRSTNNTMSIRLTYLRETRSDPIARLEFHLAYLDGHLERNRIDAKAITFPKEQV